MGTHIVTNIWNTLNQINLSYFVGVSAGEPYPQEILLGDHNVGSVAAANVPATSSAFEATIQYSYPNTYWFAWTPNDIHMRTGNVALCDGSAQQYNVRHASEHLDEFHQQCASGSASF